MTDHNRSEALRAYQPEDMFRSKHVMDAVVSPDGSFVVYQLSEIERGASPDADQQISSLWRVDFKGGEPRRLTAKGYSAAAPQFTPNGRSILYLAARGAPGTPAQVWRLPLDGGEAEAVSALEQGVTAFALSPDGNQLALAAFDKPAADPASAHKRISRHAWRLDPVPGYLQDLGQAIYVAPMTGDGEAKPLTSHDGIIQFMEWSPNSREIAAIVLGKGEHTTSPILGDLCIFALSGAETILASGYPFSAIFWTVDGEQVGFLAPPEGNLTRQCHIYLVSRTGGEPIDRTPASGLAFDGKIQPGSPAWFGKGRVLPSIDGERILVPVAQGGDVGIWSVALEGEEACTPVISGTRTCKLLALPDGHMLFAAQDFVSPPELFVADTQTGEERALTRHNSDWRAEVAWPRIERLTVTSEPGVEIEGWVMLPPAAGAPHKTLLFIHGGPHSGWGATFNEDFLEMAGAGWAVAFANSRGSTGYGDDFAQAIVGCWGEPETRDFHAFLDELIARGLANPDRLGVTGVSGGGHLTAWLIGHTDRFKAAVPEQGVYNMFSMYGVSDAGVELLDRELGGPPHEQFELYWKLSPIAHAHRCKTPTLLIQGENDIRCPMEQAEQLYTILKRNGCEVELLRLANCNHALQIAGPPALRRVRMDALKGWFDKHIGA